MSAATLAVPAPARAPQARPAERLFEAGGRTLEDAVLEAWHELVSGGWTACPVCGGELRAGSGCADCGSSLA